MNIDKFKVIRCALLKAGRRDRVFWKRQDVQKSYNQIKNSLKDPLIQPTMGVVLPVTVYDQVLFTNDFARAFWGNYSSWNFRLSLLKSSDYPIRFLNSNCP